MALARRCSKIADYQYNHSLRKKCVAEFIANNHQNQLVRVLNNQKLIEIESEADSDEEVQDLLVNESDRNQDFMCLRLGNQSVESNNMFMDSMDVIEL